MKDKKQVAEDLKALKARENQLRRELQTVLIEADALKASGGLDVREMTPEEFERYKYKMAHPSEKGEAK